MTKLQNTYESSNNWQVPIEILKHLFFSNRISLLPLYLLATRQREFLGHIKKSKLNNMAKLLSRSALTVKRQLRALEELGLCREKESVWMFTGGNFFTATCGLTRVKSVKVENLNRSYLTTLAYSVLISQQGKRLTSKKKQQPSIKWEGLKVPISCSYTSAWIGKSVQAISKRRKEAKKLGMLRYERTAESVMTGGIEVLTAYSFALHGGYTKKGEYLRKRNGLNVWINENPAVFTELLLFSTRSVGLELKKLARNRYGLLSS